MKKAQIGTAKLLVELSMEGKLGQMLARTFNGKIGDTYPQKDSDFVITFETKSALPPNTSLINAIQGLFQEHGFEVKFNSNEGHCVDFTVKSEGFLLIAIITIPYPTCDNRASLRVTTQFPCTAPN